MSVATLSVHKVRVQRRTNTIDSSGGVSSTWSTQFTTNCRIQPRSGDERVLYQRETEVVSHIVYVPGNPDIQHQDRLVPVGLTRIGNLEVKLVRDIDQLGEFLTIECEEQN
jgi:SPP1 family predicted phage head-tail adaptor